MSAQKLSLPYTVRPASSEATAEAWGWLPALSVVGAGGLVLVALAYNASWQSLPWSTIGQWIGLLTIFVPTAARLSGTQANRRERIGLVLLLALLLYVARVMYSPLEFKFSDEIQHWRSTADILESHRLFQPNPLLPISPSYPGLENVTVALSQLGGLSIFESGTIVMGIARLVLTLALFLFYEKISQSDYVAGLASLLYMTNPHYQSFAAMFVYQSLALPLAALVLYIELRKQSAPGRRSIGWNMLLMLGLIAVVATHHITSYALTAYLVVWTIVAMIRRRSDKTQGIPFWTALAALALILIWIGYVATETIGYLAPTWTKTVGEIVRLITLEARAGETFRAPTSPIQEQLISYASVATISLGVCLGGFYLWRRHRNNVLAITMGLCALAYLFSIVIRLVSSAGAELTGRSWSFTFVAVGFVVAVGFIELWKFRQGDRKILWLFVALSILWFAGGITSGWPPYWGRLPGPYLVSAGERSIDRENVAAAEEVRTLLGPDNRVAADLTNHLLMGSYGRQSSDYGLATVYFAPQLGDAERERLRYLQIRYLIVDRRLSSGLPVIGYYFNQREPQASARTSPIPLEALTKFDQIVGVSRIFDSGNIAIYDVRALSGAP